MNYMLQKPAYANVLTECPGDQLKNGICIFASKGNEMLITILNKTINYISEEEEADINTRGLWMNPYERTFTDVLYEYRFLFMGILISIILVASVYTVLVHRMTNLRIEMPKQRK